jgi:DHA1 family inner membrane transport protein
MEAWMLEKAYRGQCAAMTVHCTDEAQRRKRGLTLFSLALGSFCIGTSEFASMGILQLFSASLGIDISTATNAIAAYALGVVIGAPLVTLVAARLNRAGSVCLNSLRAVSKWISALVMPQPGLAAAR